MLLLLDTPTLTVTYTTKKVPPLDGAFLSRIKETILKKNYELSIICVGLDKMQNINLEYRKLDKPTDILSFPLEINTQNMCGTGEIYLCFDMIEKKAKLFNISLKQYTEYVLVHGMVHLLGYDHGDQMDKLEKIYTKKLHIHYPYRYTKEI